MDTSPNEMGASLQARLAGLANRRVIGEESHQNTAPQAANTGADEHNRTETGRPAEAAAPHHAASFTDIGHLLEQRSREWAAMVRELGRRRQHLAFAQAEQDLACEQLGRIVPVVQDTYRSLKSAIEARQSGIEGGPIEEITTMHVRALDELEKLAGTLNAQASWYRMAWEQYLQVAESARRLRGQLD